MQQLIEAQSYGDEAIRDISSQLIDEVGQKYSMKCVVSSQLRCYITCSEVFNDLELFEVLLMMNLFALRSFFFSFIKFKCI